MSDLGLSARKTLFALPGLVANLRVSDFDETDLQALLGEVRMAQRCLDGLTTRIGMRANELAQDGKSAPADETARGDGTVGARQARREAARARLAAEVAGVDEAMAAGVVSGEHVDSIARHSAKLSEEQRASFDFDDLIARATGLTPETFDRLAKRRIEQIVDADGLRETKSQQADSKFRHWIDQKTGMGRFCGSLDPERYETLINAIEQHMNALAGAADEPVTKSANLAAAALLGLISNGGNGRGGLPSITVVVDHDTIVHGTHAGSIRQTQNGSDLATASIARLCCDAVIRKVVLDERGVPIDVGRKHRTATDGQWAALKTLHNSCAWGGCDAPISWCQAHHIHEWEHGGVTDFENLIPLCSRHHHQVHEGRWHIKLAPDRTLKSYKPDGSHHATIPNPQRC